jgi:acetyltransferase-like isoleucine patch superfamily enzyme
MPELTKLLKLNPIVTARHRGKVLVFRNTRFRVARSARMSVAETLRLGGNWPGAPLYPGHFIVHDDAELTVGRWGMQAGLRVDVQTGARLHLGSGGGNNDVRIGCYEDIHIGTNVIMGVGVTIRDSDGHSTGAGKPQSAPIRIEDNVWLGLGSTVLKGVTIGEGAIVSAGSVVVKDVPPHSLVGGVPATVKRTDVGWKM